MVFDGLKQNWNPIKSRYAIILLAVPMISIISIIYWYGLFSTEILESLLYYEGMVGLVFIVSIRIIIMGILTIFIFLSWLRAEESYISDIPCLMGIFFGTITFGKTIDILHNLTHYTATLADELTILRIRYFVIIGTAIPLLFLGINMLLTFKSLDEGSKYKDEALRVKVRNIWLSVIIGMYIVLVAITPTTTMFGLMLPVIMFPALLLTTWLFVVAYRNKRLSQVHPGILSVGFLLYIFSNIFRPVAQNIIGENITYVFVSEMLDVIVFIVIFIGLIIKKEYKV